MNWYVGVSGGYTSTDIDEFGQSAFDDVTDALGFQLSPSDRFVPDKVRIDDSDTGWKVFGGVKLSRFLAMEVFYVHLGKYSQSVATPALADLGWNGIEFDVLDGTFTVHSGFEANAYGAEVIGKVPVNERIELFAKLGLASWDVEADISGSLSGTTIDGSPGALPARSVSVDDDGTDIVWGFGGALKFSDHWNARLEWERFEINAFNQDADTDYISLGIEFVF